MSLKMEVALFNRQRSFVFSAKKLKALVQEAIAFERHDCHEVAIHLVGKQRMCQLHGKYFHDFSLTDCLSFPISEWTSDYRALGDVFVCPQVALSYAKAHGEEPYSEVTLYVIHGLLHLMGYDDITIPDQKKMRAAEAKHMRHLKTKQMILSK